MSDAVLERFCSTIADLTPVTKFWAQKPFTALASLRCLELNDSGHR